MEPIYNAARVIINRAQPSLDGGLIIYLLHNFVHFSTSNDYVNITIQNESKITDHLLSTFARTGFALGIVFSIIWTIFLLIAGSLLCQHRNSRIRRKSHLLYLAGTGHPNLNDNEEISHSARRQSPKSIFLRTRERLQTSWVCLATQFSFLSILTILLGTAVLLGFAASAQFHANLSSPPTYEESVGRLLTPAELARTNPSKTHVFPRVLRGLAHLRAYVAEFVPNTKEATESIVQELINATNAMQSRISDEFNKILFDEIGVTQAFELGKHVGTHSMYLMKKYGEITNVSAEFRTIFNRLKVEFQSWLRLINSYNPVNDPHCVEQCQLLRSTFINNLTVRPDTIMPTFEFALALNFVTSNRNQSAEDQLNQGEKVMNDQLNHVKQVMATRINIPQSIRNMTNRQWDFLGTQFNQLLGILDEQALMITRTISPKVSSGSSLLLTLNLFFCFIILIGTIGLIWLIIHYHCIPLKLSQVARSRVKLLGAIGFFVLAISLLVSTTYFLLGGYAHTEVCRYLNPNQEMLNVVEYDPTQNSHVNKLMFPIDSHINTYLSRNWDSIVKLIEKVTPKMENKPIPLPHIRSPVYGLAHNCRENMGILGALDAIKDFDISSLNDPQMSARFTEIGKEIMIDSMKSINIDEIFPKTVEDDLAMASRLDDFIVNYDEIRKLLPTTYFSIQLQVDDYGNYTLWPVAEMWLAWDQYFTDYLKYRLSVEQINRLNGATEKVRKTIIQLDLLILSLHESLANLSAPRKIAPYVHTLQTALTRLKLLMSNKPAFINRAVQLFDQHVKQRTQNEAMNIILQFGPKLMSKVGPCRRLYNFMDDINSALCIGIVDVMNGFWFLIGWITFIGTLSLTFSLLFFIHKSSLTHTSGKPLLADSMHRKHFKSHNDRFASGSMTSEDLGYPSELKPSHKPNDQVDLNSQEDNGVDRTKRTDSNI